MLCKWNKTLLKLKQSSSECLKASSALIGKKMVLFPCIWRTTAAHRGQKYGKKRQHALRACALFSPGAGREREHRQINIPAGISPPEVKVNLQTLSRIKAHVSWSCQWGKCRTIFVSARTLASVQTTWGSKVSAMSCANPLRWNRVKVQLVLGQERRGGGRGQ